MRRFIEVDHHEAVSIGDVVENSEAIKVDAPKFNKEVYQNGFIGEGVGEMTLCEGEGRYVALFLQHRHSGRQQMGATECGRGQACHLPRHGEGRRKSGMRTCEQGSQRPPSEWKQEGQDAVEGEKRHSMRRVL